jgi:cysteine synthase A
VLGASEKSAVFCHAREWFPDLVPTGAGGFDDLPLIDKAGAAVWYGHAVEDSQFFFSSGTSGEPKPVPWTAAEDGWYVGEKRELLARWLGECSRVLISLAVGHNAGSAHLIFHDLGIEVHDAGLSSLTTQVEAIRMFAPEVLYCSPSILARLVTELEQTGECARSVRRVITNGEILYPSARARLEAFFGLGRDDIMDTYGSTEIGTIAFSCPSCAAFHFLDGIFPEAGPPHLMAGSELGGMSGAVPLVLSSTKRTSFPVIRFVTYDVVEGLRRADCSSGRPFGFDRVLGRCDEIINYGELFPIYPLADMIGGRIPRARWFVLNPHNDVTVVIEGDEPDGFGDELRRRYPLHNRMVELGLLDPPEIRFVREFDAFVSRAGIATSSGGREAPRIVRRAPEPWWFEDPGG